MEQPKTYCEFVGELDDDNIHRIYHDTQYGFPIESDNELFCRLVLEINQAGLSWTTILKKQENFRKAFSNFNISKVASYGEKDIHRLLNDSGIIRNKLKVNAVVYNAKVVTQLQKEHGSFNDWLIKQCPKKMKEWVKLFKATFRFTGGEITKEFIISSGFSKGAHHESCPIYQEVLKKKPIWIREG